MKRLFYLILIVFMNFEMSQAQDWANLNKYKAENEKLSPPAAGEKRIVFMGNSITEGWMEKYPEFFAGKPYINRGISGQTTPQMLLRFRSDVINLKPSLVVILAGTNDIAGNTGPSTLEMILGNIASMAELAHENGIKVILCSVLPAIDYYWKPGVEPADKIIALNKMIKNYADTHNCYYLDYYSSMVDDKKGLRSDYSPDGVHPNLAGYKVMEKIVEEAISKVLITSK